MNNRSELDKAFIDMMWGGIGFYRTTINEKTGNTEVKYIDPKDVNLTSEEIEKLKKRGSYMNKVLDKVIHGEYIGRDEVRVYPSLWQALEGLPKYTRLKLKLNNEYPIEPIKELESLCNESKIF